MRSLFVGLVFAWCFLEAFRAPASADGGSLRLSGVQAGYQINVFTSPTPFRAGDVDISVLVLDAATGDLVTQAAVTVRMTKSGRSALEYAATTEAATNKLFRAAQFKIPEPGRWQLQVEINGLRGHAVIGGDVDVAAPLPRWRELWPWICWPAVAVVLFGFHQMSLSKRARQESGTFRNTL
jgi:hypothetical protein